MIKDDAGRFKSTLAAVYSLYGKDLTEAVIGIWWQALKPYDLAAVKDALNRHAVNPDNGQFCPKPADVVKMIEGGSEDAALVAWAKVDRAARHVGPYQTVVFDDALIHKIVQVIGGWPRLGQIDDQEWPFTKNQFVALYRGFKASRREFEYPRSLPGITEATNGAIGCDSDPPCLIGNRESALRVYQHGNGAPALSVEQIDPLNLTFGEPERQYLEGP